MQFDYLNKFPPSEQMPTLLTHLIEDHPSKDVGAELARHLGYSSAHIIDMMMKGSKNLQIGQIIPLAKFFNINFDELLPYWISQEVTGEHHAALFDAMQRIVPTFELLILDIAREVYLGDAAEDL